MERLLRLVGLDFLILCRLGWGMAGESGFGMMWCGDQSLQVLFQDLYLQWRRMHLCIH